MLKKTVVVFLFMISEGITIVKGQCVTPVSLPYFEGFENTPVDSTPQCYTKQIAYPTSILDAKVGSGTTYAGTKYLYLTNGSLSYADC